MINREEYSALILELKAANSEIERLQAENKELRDFLEKFRDKTAFLFQ
tara:strand:- start:7702 stop:7845 length:144 start_codon:yes stop_codon:yes gene_type:complete